MNHKNLPLALEVLAEAQITAHIIGEAGVGKSQGIYQYGEKIGAKVVEVRVALMADAGDLVGLQEFIQNEKSGKPYATRHVLPEWFMQAVLEVENASHNEQPVILFFDELSRGHKDLLQAIFELVYDRALKGTKVRNNVIIVAASNPTTDDYAGSMEFSDDAFQDRFCHLKFEPTNEEFFSYGRKTGKVAGSIVDFLQEQPKLIDKEHQAWTMDFVQPSRRSWERVSLIESIIEKKGPEFKEIELELFFGIVGEKAALAYMDFRRTYIRSLKADKVLNEYLTNTEVRNNVAGAIEKNRLDMLATLNEELLEEIAKLSSLTQAQADNIGALVTDLPVESAFALVNSLLSNGKHSSAVQSIDGKSPGLYEHKAIVKRMTTITEERKKIKEQAKKIEAKKKKKVDNDEIPF